MASVAVVGVGLSGCGDSTDPEQPPTGGSTVALEGRAVEFPSMDPLGGLQVCWYDDADHPCSSTDDEGSFVLEGLPGGSEVTIEYTLDGYIPQLGTAALPETGTVNVLHTAVPQTLSDMVVDGLGTTADAGKGHVSGDAFGADGMGIAGIAFTMIPTSGIGPAYGQAGGLPSPSLDATETGAVLWVNVNPGEVEIIAEAVDGSLGCTAAPMAWPAAAANATRVPVVAGYLTHFFHFECQ